MAGRPLIIELMGPAGVGKTTLADQLQADGDGVRRTMWYVPKPMLARSTLRQLPTAATLYRETGKLLWSEVKHLARLDALYTYVKTTHWNGTRLVVLDEGPIYTFSWLQVIGHPSFAFGPRLPFWHQTLLRWSRCLDAVVILDAPNPVLAQRIRTRAKPHPLKRCSLDAIASFANAYRRATAQVLTELQMIGGPPVLRLNVGENGDDGLQERVREALRQSVDAR